MSRKNKFRDIAIDNASKSTCKFKHGALITKGNKIICKGNNTDRSSFLGKLDYQQHAEMNVVTKFFNTCVRKNPNLKSKIHEYKVIVVRLSNKEPTKTVYSAPCAICTQRLLSLGFKTIIFSNDHDEMEEINLEKYTHKHFTSNYIKKYKLGMTYKDLYKKMDLVPCPPCTPCQTCQ